MAHYLITGHTGFKGAWLTMVLAAQGHTISGISLPPQDKSLFLKAEVSKYLQSDIRLDIRNREELVQRVQEVRPDYLVHFAAQALVIEGYRKPLETYETNVTGTLNVLVAAEKTDSIRAQLIVTTDKVYRDSASSRAYVETDPLGGTDPYSASKAAADILAQERLAHGEAKPGAIVRAGNVIGVGDRSKNRLIPDIVRSIKEGSPLRIRNPGAVRPWQHVLDCLNGYLKALAECEASRTANVWNFGPAPQSAQSVSSLLDSIRFNSEIQLQNIQVVEEPMFESGYLVLDSTKARQSLGWTDVLDFDSAVSWALCEATSRRDEKLESIVSSQIQHFFS